MNKLQYESSPYLLQHANNPVDWYPYGEEAFKKAESEGKLIFLSIGYSSCHWCHVMARESFENFEVAEYLNTYFVSIKIDREEYPGVDKIYQELFQMLNKRGGGWPLSVWLTPEGKPFFVGTYFPNKPKFNMPSFLQVCKRIVELWDTQREQVVQQAESFAGGMDHLENYINQVWDTPNLDVYLQVTDDLRSRFDRTFGGIGGAPKFPRVSTLRFLLRQSQEGDSDLHAFVKFTFSKISQGGIFDQIGGGYMRYSVDAKWLVPHFEKMLYDNGQLLLLAAELYATSKNNDILRYIDLTIQWLEEQMLSPHGAFYSALNAESEGEEGKYYVFTHKELEEVLSSEELDEFVSYFGVTKEGNFEDPHHPEKKGLNVLSVVGDIIPTEAIKKVKAYRESRVPPDLDDKIITSWNALMITGLLGVVRHTGHSKAMTLAKSALDYILNTHVTDNMVIRYSKDSSNHRVIEGILDDYSYLAETLLLAYEVTGEERYLHAGHKITKLAIGKFYRGGVFYLQPKGSSTIGRSIQLTDDAMPSSLAVMVRVIYKVGRYLDSEILSIGEQLVNRYLGIAKELGAGVAEFLNSARYYLTHPVEVVHIGEGELLTKTLAEYIPELMVFRGDHPAVQDKPDTQEETLYICRQMACSLPLTRSEYSREELFQRINLFFNS